MESKTGFKKTEIGMIPYDWKLGTLGDFCSKIGSGSTPKGGSKVYVESGISFIRSQNVHDDGFKKEGLAFIDEKSAKKLRNVEVQENDVLLNITGDSICRCSIVPKEILPARVNQHVSIIRTDNNLYSKFLFYYLSLKNTKDYLLSFDAGGTRKAITKSSLEKFIIPVPNYSEQVMIGDFLGLINQKIELNRQMNTTLEQMAQAIFKHWFIDFEFPDENGKPYRSSGGEMVDSELGEIPVGWEVKQIGNVCKIVGGGTPKTKEPSYWEDGDIFWATPTDMTSLKSPIIFDTSRKITNKGLENSSAKLLPINSILMTSRATLGYFAINKVPICTNQGFISMIRDEDISKYYLLNAVRNKMETIESLAGGSTYPEISKTVFKSIKIIVPLLRVMQKYETFCDFLYEKIYSNDLENINLSEFRDTLLPKLMSGKIRVKP
jgi:type I restriction enzyme S subunit